MIIERLENIRLIMGDKNIRKMPYGEQLKCLVQGIKYFSGDPNTFLDYQVYIMSLFHKHLKKKYPNMSDKKLTDMAGKLFMEGQVSSKTNENIKKLVLDEARKFFITTLVKASQKNKSANNELHIVAGNRIIPEYSSERENIIFWVCVLGLAILMALGFGLME